MTPRIAPIDMASLTDEQRVVAGTGASHVVRTLLRRPDLFDAWVGLGGALVSSGRLPARDRELAILRVALRTGAVYEWANHAPAALAAGVTRDEIAALTEDGEWAPADAALLAAVDEVCAGFRVTDDTWAALGRTRDDGELIELVLVIGFYVMNAGMLNSLGVEPEVGRPGLGRLPEAAAEPAPPRRPVGAGSGPLEGTWEVTFRHPAGNQRLTLTLERSGDAVTGSVTNPALGITIPLGEGTATGSQVSFCTVMTLPVRMELRWSGTVDGDSIQGDVAVPGAGTFPFDGARA